jgi:hypothetical protein
MKMKNMKLILFMVLVLGMVLLIAPAGWTQAKPGEKAPVITNAYAVDKGQYGTIWKIYLEAGATDAEMVKIAAVVNQPAQGQYPTDFTLLKLPYRNHLKGYLQWNTFSSFGPTVKEGDQITLRVSIIDKAGNESKEVIFPFTFVSGTKGQGPLPAPFDQGDIPLLGHINIDLLGSEKEHAD